jgi:hypothetical protein
VRNGEDAALFDQTSADSVISLATGFNLLEGEVTVTQADLFTLYGFANAGSATLDSPSFIEIRRVA